MDFREEALERLKRLAENYSIGFEDPNDRRSPREQLEAINRDEDETFRGLLKVFSDENHLYVAPAQYESEKGRRLVFFGGKPRGEGGFRILWFFNYGDRATYNFPEFTLSVYHAYPQQKEKEFEDVARFLKQGIEVRLEDVLPAKKKA